VSTTEELLPRKSSGSGLEIREYPELCKGLENGENLVEIGLHHPISTFINSKTTIL
jgi:hypothetical protein